MARSSSIDCHASIFTFRRTAHSVNDETRLDGTSAGLKRFFDIAISATGLIITLPVLLLLIVIIRFDSRGRGLFVQDRVGRNGKIFQCYKLRTMCQDAPNVPTHQAAASHLTRIGSALRRTKLDELPQLWNVLRGDMSLVGPRPCLPNQTILIDERRSRGVLAVRPGITGISQIEGIDMSDPVRLAVSDERYLRQGGIRTDAKLLFYTFFKRAAFGDRIEDGGSA